MRERLKKLVFEANLSLPKYGLTIFTWGNVSGIDRGLGLVAIKPSGVEYETMSVDDMVILDLDGNRVEGKLNPSSDAPTHLALYKAFPDIGGIAHTHSRYATIFAQAGLSIPALGTTHADYFRNEIPCTRGLTTTEIQGNYEKETGLVIIERFKNIDANDTPAALVHSHGPFTWGKDPADAARNAAILEEVATMAWQNISFNPGIQPIGQDLLDRHYLRKHGKGAYYGQR